MDKSSAKTAAWWDKHKPTKRRIVQLYCALLYNAHLRGFAGGKIFTGNIKAVCVPGLNCYSCPGAIGACPLGALQNALGSLNKHIGFYVIGIVLLYGMLLGRTVCGWLCPMGLIQELLHKIPTPKVKKNRVTRILSYLKYVILVIFVCFIPIYFGIFQGIPLPGFCKYICPAGTLEGAVALLPGNPEWLSMLGPVFTLKFMIMVLAGLACIFLYRAFCRFICPLGAIYGMFNALSVVGVKVDRGRCNNCGACVRNCKMDVKRVGDHECIHCAQCAAVCDQNALSFTIGSRALIKSGDEAEGSGKRKLKGLQAVCLVAAVPVLVFLLIWTNKPDPYAIEAASIDAPVGYEVGERLEDFEAICLDGSTFDLSECRGKVVFINLWATYCGPCVKELPYFEELYHEHGDDMAVLAVHSGLTTEDVEEYVRSRGWDIPVAIDDPDDRIFSIVNGSLALPRTIVLDRNGVVIYNEVGSVNEEMLEQLFEKADLTSLH